MNGTIFNIKRFSIHDGPGIRTTVFLKGCPLSCIWCHNPEGIQALPSYFYDSKLCLNCLKCVQNCSMGCITKSLGNLEIDLERCSRCDACVIECPSNALRKNGKNYTSEALLEIIKKDIPFYDESGGGVTFSGGEPLFQFDFLLEMLKKCKEQGINTAVDTSGYCLTDRLEKIENLVDLFLYDIKLANDDEHVKYTGVSNTIIIENLKFLISQKSTIWIRLPLIPGLTDKDENIDGILDLLRSSGYTGRVYLLPYHDLSDAKAKKMIEKDYNKSGDWAIKEGMNELDVDRIKERIQNNDFEVRIGG